MKLTQRQKLLELFSDKQWHSNYQLNEMMFNYKGRIFDLKKLGYLFERRHDIDTKWSWRLLGKVTEAKEGELW